MPLYEYRCLDCNNKFEVLLRDPSGDVICEKCGSKNTKRLISAFSFASSGDTGVKVGSACSTCSSKSCSTCRTS